MMPDVQSDRPARHRRAVALCCDDRYLPYAAFVADAIARLTPDRDFDIVICALDDLTLPPVLEAHGVRFCRIDTKGAFSDLFLNTRFTESVYLRLALPAAFADQYDRILYLDCDVVIRGGDFGALMNVDMQGHAVAAVRDNIQWRRRSSKPKQFKMLNWKTGPYFNSGVMLIDCKAFVAQDIANRCVAFGRENKGRMAAHDQALLNCVLRGDWAELSPMWNWQYSPKTSLFEPMGDIHVVHFIRATKPWNDVDGELSPRFPAELARFLTTHVPEHAPIPQHPGPLSDPQVFRRTLLRQWFKSFLIHRYLARFPTDLAVLTP